MSLDFLVKLYYRTQKWTFVKSDTYTFDSHKLRKCFGGMQFLQLVILSIALLLLFLTARFHIIYFIHKLVFFLYHQNFLGVYVLCMTITLAKLSWIEELLSVLF